MGAWFPAGLLDVLESALTKAGDETLQGLAVSLRDARQQLAQLSSQQTVVMQKGRVALEADPASDSNVHDRLQPLALQF